MYEEKTRTYFPPGLWYTMVPGPGRPWFWHLPPPHHPMEAVAARRGWGGVEGQNPEPSPVAWAGARRGPWLDHVDTLSSYLILTPQQGRLLWHLLTPMRTNGGEPWNWRERSLPWRKLLYAAAGLRGPTGYAYEAAAAPYALGSPLDAPTRMRFWGTEITGEVEL